MTDEKLNPLPWAGDVEAWLEVSNAEEIADDIERYVRTEVAKAIAVEREACAMTCEELPSRGSAYDVATLDCAVAIRERSNTPKED
jgi:hypothetical protein